jgi:hypothetical protein
MERGVCSAISAALLCDLCGLECFFGVVRTYDCHPERSRSERDGESKDPAVASASADLDDPSCTNLCTKFLRQHTW